MAIYWRLREALDKAGMTPLELARALGVTHPTVYRLVAQKRFSRISEAKLDAICKAVGCTPGDLLDYRKR